MRMGWPLWEVEDGKEERGHKEGTRGLTKEQERILTYSNEEGKVVGGARRLAVQHVAQKGFSVFVG